MGAFRSTLVRHLAGAAAGLLALYVLTTSVGPYRDLQIAQAAYLTCAVAGLTVLTGLGGQISLGHGAFMAVGAYTAALVSAHWGWPLAAMLAAAAVVTALAGVLVGSVAARLQGPYLAGATLAFAVGLPGLANYSHLTGLLGGQNGLTVTPPVPPAALGETFPLERWQAWIACIGAVVTLFLLANLTGGRFGRTLRAGRDDEIAAALCGLRVARLRIAATVVSAACAGLAGGLLAVVATLAAPGAFPLTLSLQLIAAIIIGGLGTLPGAVWGALILVFVPSWASDAASSSGLSHDVASNLPLAIYGLVLIAVTLAFPRGLQGGLRDIGGAVRRRLPPPVRRFAPGGGAPGVPATHRGGADEPTTERTDASGPAGPDAARGRADDGGDGAGGHGERLRR
ncbi:branched-chain amino acid ABC transporter permease [Actinomadura opuntiae]|uniref:branched-chain amino acid ABC transporter permease n=1 Tax=Actinomadura sp. OS1-43 TaxID=604315 RepID=UPI00255B1425|nr:branched-chain amino acid ABC transporter permease [Actinomadura sp. OS1-43]MDL4817084.1 branched-chain amino acid ABC transporter permease [Actinomadura sp. OS1-43]